MKNILYRIEKSIWLYPVIYSLLSALLATAVIIIDSNRLFNFYLYVPDSILTSGATARMVLSIIAGAFVTITTFTFSTTMIVLTLYMSQLSPRVVENFLKNKEAMKSYGMFISGFIYSIISLLFMKESVFEVLTISGTVGVIYIIVALVNFIRFISNVGNYIQVNNLIDRLHNESALRINEYKSSIKGQMIISEEEVNKYETNVSFSSFANGYIQQVDYKKLLNIAIKTKSVIFFNKVPGQFVTDQTEIIDMVVDSNNLYEKINNDINSCIILGEKRTEFQDISFTVQKLTEIAIKALSPGINDPHTAINCVNIIALQIRMLGDVHKGYLLLKKEDNNEGMLFYENYDFNVLLRDAFTQIIHYGQGDLLVMVSVLKAYRFILEKASLENRKVTLEHIDYFWKKILNKSYEEFEMKILWQEMREINVFK